jgi:hypothetical protein
MFSAAAHGDGGVNLVVWSNAQKRTATVDTAQWCVTFLSGAQRYMAVWSSAQKYTVVVYIIERATVVGGGIRRREGDSSRRQ